MTTPTCPACGAKFAWDNVKLICKKCGVTAEIIYDGPRAIARWKKAQTKIAFPNKRVRKHLTRYVHAGTRKKRRNKHGRRGVAR